MEMFIGFVLCLFLEFLVWATYFAWRRVIRPLPAPPQPPKTPAQLANEAVYDEQEAITPRLVSMRLQRRTQRGRRRRVMEDEYDPFE